MPDPYLSVVATARNDDHGGDLIGRLRHFLTSLRAQCAAHDLAAELVLVEWNPPPDRPSLAEVLEKDAAVAAGPCQVRIITVSPEIHRRFDGAAGLPLFQMIAKNAGIRRSRGAFVVATNVDILFSPALFETIAVRRLHPDKLYRCDRRDVPPALPEGLSHIDLLDWCAGQVVRDNTRTHIRNAQTGETQRVYPHRGRVAAAVLARTLAQCARLGEGSVFLPPGRAKLAEIWSHVTHEIHRKRLYTNASGDFTLMARKGWERLCGYPEFEMYSFHLDALLVHAAVAAGYREVDWGPPRHVFHIGHGEGSGFTPEDQTALWQRLEDAGIARLSDDEAEAMIVALDRGSRSPVFNKSNWGLGSDDLPETIW